MTSVSRRLPVAALFSLAAAVLFFSSIPVFLKHFALFLDAWTVNGVRYFMAALFWLPYVLIHHRRQAVGRSVWRDAVLPSLANICGQTGWAVAPYYNDASTMSFVARASFLFAILFGFLFLRKERGLVRQSFFWVGAGMVVLGLFAFYSGGARVGRTSLLGIGVLIATSACWGLYGVLVNRNMSAYPVRLSFGVISLYTTVGLLVLMGAFGNWRALYTVSVPNWLWLVLAAMLGIAWGHVLLYRAIVAVGPILAEAGLLFIPFVTLIGAHLVLGEAMNGVQWCGGLLLVLGSLALIVAKGRVLSLCGNQP